MHKNTEFSHLLQLFRLRTLKFFECVCVVFLQSAQRHVTDVIAHLIDVNQCWSQRLNGDIYEGPDLKIIVLYKFTYINT